MATHRLTDEIISAAITGYQAERSRIDARIAELRETLSGNTETATTPEARGRKRRKLSAEALQRIREGQRRRWAKVRGASEQLPQPAPGPKKQKRRISPEGMKRIIAATKKRWRLQKAAQAKATASRTASRETASARRKAAPSKARPRQKKIAVRKPAVKTAPAKRAQRAVPKKTGVRKTNTTPPAVTPTPEAAAQ
jgi:hypothetical protein